MDTAAYMEHCMTLSRAMQWHSDEQTMWLILLQLYYNDKKIPSKCDNFRTSFHYILPKVK